MLWVCYLISCPALITNRVIDLIVCCWENFENARWVFINHTVPHIFLAGVGALPWLCKSRCMELLLDAINLKALAFFFFFSLSLIIKVQTEKEKY